MKKLLTILFFGISFCNAQEILRAYRFYVSAGSVDTSWSGYATITTDHTQLTGDVSNYPLMISVTNTHLKTVANGGSVTSSSGYDIVPFSDISLTSQITFDREFWDGTAGTLVMWIKVNLSSSSNNTFYLAYGKSTITTEQGSNTTWDSNFKGVWHLKDGSTLNLNDATSNGINGTNHSASATSGNIDGAGSFNGSSSYVSATNNSSFSSSYTISCWVNMTASSGDDQIVASNVSSYSNYWFSLNSNAGANAWRFFLFDGTNNPGVSHVAHWGTGIWVYLVGIRNTGTGKVGIIVDDDAITEATDNTTSVPAYSELDFGFTQSHGHFNGKIDEIRTSNIVRTATWAKADYVSQKPSQTFTTITF